MAQLKRIKVHRAWLLNPPTSKPSRQDFGLPRATGTLSVDDQNRIEQSIAEKLRGYGIESIEMPKVARLLVQERMGELLRDVLSASDGEIDARARAVATHALNLPADVVATLNAEKRYRSALKQWDAYQTWKVQRNAARAELERKYGYDTKHAMHLVRLMRMGVEALEQGELHVRRGDADELATIRDGALSLDAVLDAAKQLEESMARAAQLSKLPDDVDKQRVEELALSLMLSGAG
jgi:hypothetical protein